MEKLKTDKQKVQEVLKQHGIVSQVKITKNEIHIKYHKDFPKVQELFPSMATVYGFLN